MVWRPCTYNVYCRLGSSASILRGCRDQLNGCEISSSAGAAVPTSVSAAPNPKRRRAVPAKSTMKILDCHRHFFCISSSSPFETRFAFVNTSESFSILSAICDASRSTHFSSFSFFFATALLFRFDSPFDSPFDSLRWLCHLSLFSDSVSLHCLSPSLSRS